MQWYNWPKRSCTWTFFFFSYKNLFGSASQAEEAKISSLVVSEGNRGGVSGADGSTDVRDSPGGAAVGVVLAVGQAAEHGLAPGCADHQVRDGGRLGRQGVAESVDAAENVRQPI